MLPSPSHWQFAYESPWHPRWDEVQLGDQGVGGRYARRRHWPLRHPRALLMSPLQPQVTPKSSPPGGVRLPRGVVGCPIHELGAGSGHGNGAVAQRHGEGTQGYTTGTHLYRSDVILNSLRPTRRPTDGGPRAPGGRRTAGSWTGRHGPAASGQRRGPPQPARLRRPCCDAGCEG